MKYSSLSTRQAMFVYSRPREIKSRIQQCRANAARDAMKGEYRPPCTEFLKVRHYDTMYYKTMRLISANKRMEANAEQDRD